jgi:hypothetical protein
MRKRRRRRRRRRRREDRYDFRLFVPRIIDDSFMTLNQKSAETLIKPNQSLL